MIDFTYFFFIVWVEGGDRRQDRAPRAKGDNTGRENGKKRMENVSFGTFRA